MACSADEENVLSGSRSNKRRVSNLNTAEGFRFRFRLPLLTVNVTGRPSRSGLYVMEIYHIINQHKEPDELEAA